MPINFKTDTNYGFSLLPLFGVSQSLIDNAQKAGVNITQPSAGKFAVMLGDKTIGTVAVSGAAITLAKQKTLGPASKGQFNSQFTSLLNQAIGMAQPSPLFGPETAVKKATTFVESEPAKPAKSTFSPAVNPSVSKEKMGQESPVALVNAEYIGQPTKGTSPGAVYRLVMVYEGVKVAVRVKAKTLSIRAEGSALSQYSLAFQALSMDNNGGYWSGHYDVTTKDLMIKTLGALYALMGPKNCQAHADFSSFVNNYQ